MPYSVLNDLAEAMKVLDGKEKKRDASKCLQSCWGLEKLVLVS